MSSIGNSTSQKSSSSTKLLNNKTGDNFIRNINPIKTIEENEYINGQHKSCYNYNSTLNSKTNSPTTTTGGSNTILITHNYSQESDLIKKNTNKNSSSITIVTTHNNNNNANNCSNRDINSTTTFDSDNNINGNVNNNSGYRHLSMEKIHPIINGNKNDGSSPVIVDSINICINNHFNEIGCKMTTTTSTKSSDNDITKFIKKEKLTDHINTEPDSTTNHNNNCNNNFLKTSQVNEMKTKTTIFLNGMDVLVLKEDEKFYLGTIVAAYPLKLKCLVKFDDGSKYWAAYEELKLFGGNKTNNDDSGPMCVICKKVNKNDIVELCERCGRGCHRHCAEGGYKNGIWSCKRCSTENGLKKLETSTPTNKTELPYDLNALNWDGKHHVNEEQIYCYCGKTGRWEKKMLQCCKCQQWFHENCIRCLKYPLYNGDRFYIFVCSICNNGTEFVRRLEMKWSDIVHLILYNLTTNNQDKKYHHINKTIVPYANDNWPKLQLQNSLKNLSSNEIKENILKTLIIHKNRFKSCREIKKNNSFWGLRSRIPTVPPKILIPPDINVTEQYIKQNLKINFIPTKLQNHIKSDKISDETNSSDLKFSSEDEIPIKNIIKKDKNYQKNKNENNFNNIENKKVHIKQNRKKKSTYLSTVEGESIKKLISNKIGKIKNTATKKQIIESIYNTNSNNFNNNNCDSSDETSSLGTLDLIIPPPKNFQGRNNPFRFTPKKNETNYNNFNINLLNNNNNYNINNNFDITSKLVALKKSGNGKIFNFNNINEKYLNNYGVTGDFPTAGQFRIVRTVKRRLSAKDLVIGPNKEIKKRRLRRSSGNVEIISTTIQSLPRKANNYMPLIRQEPLITSFKPTSSSLCTNTILSSSSSSTASTPLATTPTILESTTANSPAVNLFNSTTNTNLIKNYTGTTTTISRRNLRKREEKNYSENHRRNSNSSISTNCSNTSNNGLGITSSSAAPILNSTAITVIDNSITKSTNSSSTTNFNQHHHQKNDCSISDLQNSVNMYFGAIERIKNGEKFSVKAKRKLPNGKTQYLVEWDVGGITTMNQ